MTDIIWDIRPLYVYAQTPKEHYQVIESRYNKFLEAVNDIPKDPVTVFEPLNEKQITELELIREVSVVLQAKKDEDMRKTKAAAEEVEEPKAEQAEEKETEVEQKKEETPEETSAQV